MKTLIAYTTKHGTVEKAAHILKSKLPGEVHLVNLMKENAPELQEYDTVILGGSIYIGKIQGKLQSFVSINLPILLEKKIGLFICAGEKDKLVKDEELEKSFPQELFKHAIVKEIFGFEINLEALNSFERFLIKKIKGVKETTYNLSEEIIFDFDDKLTSRILH